MDEKIKYHLAEAQKQAEDLFYKKLLKQYGFLEGKAVLDIGCGLGQTLWLLGEGPKVKIGVDIDGITLLTSKRMAQNRGEKIWFIQASSNNLPFTDAFFTHLVSRVTLNYVNQTKSLAEISRILKNEGIFYCKVEAVGFDLNLIRNSHSLRELISRLHDLLNGFFYNITGKQYSLFPFLNVGRTYCSKFYIKKLFKMLNLDIIHFRSVGKNLFLPKSFEIIAKKSNNIKNSKVSEGR